MRDIDNEFIVRNVKRRYDDDYTDMAQAGAMADTMESGAAGNGEGGETDTENVSVDADEDPAVYDDLDYDDWGGVDNGF